MSLLPLATHFRRFLKEFLPFSLTAWSGRLYLWLLLRIGLDFEDEGVGGMGGPQVVMVPCEVPAPQHERLSLYKKVLSGFYLSADCSVLVAVPGRRARTVAQGLRWAVEQMRLGDVVAVGLRRDSVFLFRLQGRGSRS